MISEDLGIKLENLQLSQLGRAKQVKVNKDSTTIVQGAGERSDIVKRIDQLRRQIEETESEYDKEKFQERLAKISGGVAVISVGAATEAEMKEVKARVKDALHATRAAADEGIVPGGGTALIRVIPVVQKVHDTLTGDEKVGAQIILRALEEPVRHIASNSGSRRRRGGRRGQERTPVRPASTPIPANTWTCSPPGSSTPPRSPEVRIAERRLDLSPDADDRGDDHQHQGRRGEGGGTGRRALFAETAEMACRKKAGRPVTAMPTRPGPVTP